MIGQDELNQAAWDNDALVDEGHTLPDILNGLGLDRDGLYYIAGQRALRAVLLSRGPHMQRAIATKQFARQYSIEKLKGKEKAMFDVLVRMYVDAACTVSRAVRNEE